MDGSLVRPSSHSVPDSTKGPLRECSTSTNSRPTTDSSATKKSKSSTPDAQNRVADGGQDVPETESPRSQSAAAFNLATRILNMDTVQVRVKCTALRLALQDVTHLVGSAKSAKSWCGWPPRCDFESTSNRRRLNRLKVRDEVAGSPSKTAANFSLDKWEEFDYGLKRFNYCPL